MTRNMQTYNQKMFRISTHRIFKAKSSSLWTKSFGEFSTKRHNERIRRASIKVTRFERWKQLRN